MVSNIGAIRTALSQTPAQTRKPKTWIWLSTSGCIGIEQICDYLGERLASLFGINAPKYQYAIDEYYRIKKEEEEEEEENRLAEEAERQFNLHQRSGQNNPTLVEQPETSTASFVNISFELQPEPPLSAPDSDRVPSPLPS